MRISSLLAALVCSTPLLAAPVISSLSTTTGPTSGGTIVTITGTGFLETCTPEPSCVAQPVAVFFGSQRAETEYVSPTQLIAKTPAHLPITVDVRVVQFDGVVTKADAFTFVGDVPASFTRLLLPTFTGAVHGENNSYFFTEIRATLSGGMHSPVLIEGLRGPAQWSAVTWLDSLEPHEVMYDGNPGRFVYVRTEELGSVAMNLRIFDRSRDTDNFGTEIPIVEDRHFRMSRIALPGVPGSAGFRKTLRIYNASTTPTIAMVQIGDTHPVEVHVPGSSHPYLPGYAVLNDFPEAEGPVTVTIDQITLPIADVRARLWAFVTVTNNATQLVTTVSPQF